MRPPAADDHTTAGYPWKTPLQTLRITGISAAGAANRTPREPKLAPRKHSCHRTRPKTLQKNCKTAWVGSTRGNRSTEKKLGNNSCQPWSAPDLPEVRPTLPIHHATDTLLDPRPCGSHHTRKYPNAALECQAAGFSASPGVTGLGVWKISGPWAPTPAAAAEISMRIAQPVRPIHPSEGRWGPGSAGRVPPVPHATEPRLKHR